MKVISHRGNLFGPNSETENNPDHIQDVLKKHDVEVDVWLSSNNEIFLGHNYPQYIISPNFLQHKGLWCHAKNLNALYYLMNANIKCFFHNVDDYTLTSNGYIWTYPGYEVTDKSIIVDLNEGWQNTNYNCYGVCVDYIYNNN